VSAPALVTAFAGVALLGTGFAGVAHFFGASPRTRRGVAALVTLIAVLAGAATAGYALFAVSTSATITASTADSFTPVPPPSCAWTAGNEITLTWDSDPDATSYDILRSTSANSGFASIQNVDNSTFSYVDTTVNPDPRPVGVYYYKLRVNSVGMPRTSAATTSTTCSGYIDTWAGGVADGRDATDVAMRPNGIAVVGNDLYVAADKVVRKVDLTTGATTVVAGVGAVGPAGVPGPGPLANISGSGAVAADADGNRYVSDAEQDVVYKIDDQDDIAVFAGTPGTSCNDPTGGCGNGGPATSAQLNDPIGLAVDDDGNVYIADSLDQAIRRVDTGGEITRIVGTGEPCANSTDPCGDGGSGTTAQLNTPMMLAWGNGGLFINDNADHRVRFWNGSTIETVAGTGSPLSSYGGDDDAAVRFDEPVAYAREGNVEVVAQADGRVRRNNGSWQTIAGLGPAASDAPNGDRGYATEARIPNIPIGGVALFHGRVFISDPAHHRVRVVGNDGRIGAYAGNGNACAPGGGCGDGGRALDAELTPGGLAVDANGTLFVADTDANQVRAVSPSGIITTVVGTGVACAQPTDACGDGAAATAAQLNGPTGVSYDPGAELLVVADTGDRRVRYVPFLDGMPQHIINAAGTGASGNTGDGGSPTSATFITPVAAAVSGTNLIVADTGTHRLRAFPLVGNITAYAGDGTAGNGGDGGTATSARLDAPVALGTTNDGKTVVVDRDRNRLRAIDDNDGTIDNLWGDSGGAGATWSGDGGPATDAGINPFGVAWDGAHGLLYVSDSFGGRIRRIDIAGDGTITTVAGTGSTPAPMFDTLGNPIARGFGDGGPATAAGLTIPAGLALDSAGNLYIGEFITGDVRKVDYGTGVISRIAGTDDPVSADAIPNRNAQFGEIAATARDTDGNVYVADGRRVRKITESGTTTIAGTGQPPTWGGDEGSAAAAQLDAPIAIVQDPFGNTVIADGARIRRIGVDGTIHAVAGNGDTGYSGDGNPASQSRISHVGAMATDTDGSLYFTDVDNHVVRKIDPSGNISTIAGNGSDGYTGDDGPPLSAEIGSPAGIAMLSPHVFYISDPSHAVVRKVDLDLDTISTVAGTGTAGFAGDSGAATSAQLNQPTALATDAGGTVLFIFDSANHRIRKVVGGTIATIAGDGTVGGSGDGGPALSAKLGGAIALAYSEPDDLLYVADASNNRIRAVNGAGDIERIAGSSAGTAGFAGDGGDPADAAARFDTPIGIVVSTWSTSGRHVLVADMGNRRIRSLALDGPLLTTVAGTGSTPTWGGDGGDATDAQLGTLAGIAAMPDGTLYIAENDANERRIRRIATNDTISTVAGGGNCADRTSGCGDSGTPLDARFFSINAIVATHVVNLGGIYTGDVVFVADSNRVRVLLPGESVEAYAGQAAAGDTVSGDGSAAVDASLGEPRGLALRGTYGSPGFGLYIADTAAHRVRKVDNDGIITRIAGNGDGTTSGDGDDATDAGVPSPVAVALNADGDVYILGNNEQSAEGSHLRKVDHTSGHISTLAGDGTDVYSGDKGGARGARIADATALFVDDDGNLYLAQGSTAGRIRRITGPQ
jgi:hypothetical protein